jgi:hypothetical protein
MRESPLADLLFFMLDRRESDLLSDPGVVGVVGVPIGGWFGIGQAEVGSRRAPRRPGKAIP